ncbi:MAG: class I SAM-dependent methyltransferase [Nocardioides sp.]
MPRFSSASSSEPAISSEARGALDAFVAESPVARGPITQAVREFAASVPPGSRVLDAGAGNAPYRPLFAHCDYRTHDWSESVHDGAKRADVVGDLASLPIEDACFDAVLLTEVLEHIANPEQALRELHRILTPHGRLLITVPFVVELHEEPHDHFRYTSHGLRGLLERAGFGDIGVEPLTGWFGTLANMLRHQGLSTAAASGRRTLGQRAAGGTGLVLSALLAKAAPKLDARLDHRHALPLGWVARATKTAS